MSFYLEKLKQQHVHHAESFDQKISDGSVEMWIQPDNADYWGNMLPMDPLRVPFSELNKRRILTIGDGKGGKEAVFFKNLGHEVTASDVAISVLRMAVEKGVIDHCLSLDAEQMDVADSSYDFVVTKETLHHLPRPYLAVYEMLRVANEGIVFVEPSRVSSERKQPPAEYEESGNFVFRFNTFELTQIARSYGIPFVAYGYGRMFHKKGSGNIRGIELEELKSEVAQLHTSWDAEFGKEYRSMLICIMMKQIPDDKFVDCLVENNFDVFELT